MPKIPEERRQERRMQILEAAWRCFHRNGVQSTTMEDIIGESKLAASAMYRYFSGKDDIILSAMSTSLGALAAELAPLLSADTPATPRDFVATLLAAIERFSKRKGYNLLPIAVHGWSEAQRDERARKLLRGYYLQFRARLAERAARWQREGVIGTEATPDEVARAIQSLILGYIVQSTIMRDVDGPSQARGLAALGGAGVRRPAGTGES